MPIWKKCKDPALTTVKDHGYNVVQLPRVDLIPTQLLYSSNGKLRRLGELESVFVPAPDGPPAPPILPDQPGPDIEGTKSNEINVDIGIDILGGLISALGGSTLGISMAYSRAKSVTFAFSNTKRTETDLALVDQFLASVSINRYARAARDMLDSDEVYLVSSVIKSNAISVAAKTSGDADLTIDIPVVQGAIGGNLTVEGNAASAGLVKYTGAVPLAFGFQAIRLIFEDGVYQTFKSVEAGAVSAEAAAPDLNPDVMLMMD
ncbi:MAG: hypothetical protein AB3N12_03535 [Ruegeria sp.]